jgi:hypothetical protein
MNCWLNRQYNSMIIINEHNLYEQPKYYQNTDFFPINPEEIINVKWTF